MAILKKSKMPMMKIRVVSFQRPMSRLTREGSVVRTELGSITVSLIWLGFSPSAVAASIWPPLIDWMPPLSISAV